MAQVSYEVFADTVFNKVCEMKRIKRSDFDGMDDRETRLHEDLGLSSLDVMEIIIELEEIYGIKVDNANICNIYTLSDLWSVISSATIV